MGMRQRARPHDGRRGVYSLLGPRGARGSIWVPSTWIKRRGSRLSGGFLASGGCLAARCG